MLNICTPNLVDQFNKHCYRIIKLCIAEPSESWNEGFSSDITDHVSMETTETETECISHVFTYSNILSISAEPLKCQPQFYNCNTSHQPGQACKVVV